MSLAEVPRVSVLMTVFNGAAYLEEAVSSIVNQSFEAWELIIIENGSTDNSPTILASYHDRRIIVERLPGNIGRTPALRRAAEKARGEYIAVLDADDVSHPERLAKQVTYMDTHDDVVLVGTWTVRIDGRGTVIGRWSPPIEETEIRDSLGWTNPIVHSSAMYRRCVAEDVGGYPAGLPYAQDIGLWLLMAKRGGIGIISEYLARHRTIPSSITRSKASRLIVAKDTFDVLVDAHRNLPLSPYARRRSREEITIAAFRYAVALARTGRLVEGMGMFGRAAVRNPRAVLWNRVYRAALFG